MTKRVYRLGPYSIPYWFFALLAVAAVFAGRLPAIAAERLSLVSAAGPPLIRDGDNHGFAELLAREAFRRLGIEITVAALPAERALINVNEGLDDGDLLRIPGLESRYPNLVRVPESVISAEFVAYTTGLDFPTTGWASLKPFAVGMPQGWKIYEDNVTGVRERTLVTSGEQLFQMLKNDRADVVLFNRWEGMWTARKVGMRVHVLAPPLARQDMYMYLNKRWTALVPQLTKVLQELKADGTFDSLYRTVLMPLEATLK